MKVLNVGIAFVDLIAADLPSVAAPGELIYAPRGIKTRIGGHSVNVSIDLVKLGMKGDQIGIIAAVGEDVHGELIKRALQSYGVKHFLQKVKDVETSKDLVLVVQGEDRRFHVDIGASYRLSADFVKKTLKKLDFKILYIGGAGMLGEVDEKLEEILSYAKRRDKLIFIDIVAPYKKPWNHIIPSLKYADVFHVNLFEASMVTGKTKLEDAARTLNDMGSKLALITLGEEGLYARTEDWSIKLGAFNVDVVDPTGAGDAFCAGVIHYLIRKEVERVKDLTVEECLDMLIYASAVGASATTKEGTTEGVEISFIKNLIREQEDKLRSKAEVEMH